MDIDIYMEYVPSQSELDDIKWNVDRYDFRSVLEDVRVILDKRVLVGTYTDDKGFKFNDAFKDWKGGETTLGNLLHDSGPGYWQLMDKDGELLTWDGEPIYVAENYEISVSDDNSPIIDGFGTRLTIDGFFRYHYEKNNQ